MLKTQSHYDILITGAGFAGSLTALILHKIGFKVCLLEKSRHPRFAIGESSTPVADMILRDLSTKYRMPWLHHFSRYGSWQQSHPEIICGIKRGFSFFKHHPEKEFTTDENHTNELLVAASADDMFSDTNWLRADFDSFLVNKVIETGIDYFDLAEITEGKWNSGWYFHVNRFDQSKYIRASFFIDATGSSALLHKLLDIKSSSEDFLTHSFALFSHFQKVPYWTDTLQKAGIPTQDFPYDPDHSALHHILDEGWLWMLRFNDERTSMGFVLHDEGAYAKLQAEKIWNDLLKKYPAIHRIMRHATLADPPVKIIRSGRLQRKLSHCSGPGWVALPHTAGFVDPLFSPGIAHSLSGVERIVQIISKHWDNKVLLGQSFKEYEFAVFEELNLVDYLIAGSYKTLSHFELFNSWSMLYFAIAVSYEQHRMQGKQARYFLHADSPEIMIMVKESYSDLLMNYQQPSEGNIKEFRRRIKERIQPINTAGLLDPTAKNMYKHTAVEM